ncbi:MAG: hypothetical protein MJ211_12050 [Bacteroidales bacterium]|nr:hypothetical protein [Bacteroidales bacterium]
MDFFISDLHNMDQNIITYEHRPFNNVESMRDTIINNWNSKVNDNDSVFLLGDIGNLEILNFLKGKISIILGNHDNKEQILSLYPKIEVFPYPILKGFLWLSHEPIMSLYPECPYLNIHGHLHRFNFGLLDRKWSDGNRYFNVSVEQINYTPISIDEIAEKLGIINNK